MKTCIIFLSLLLFPFILQAQKKPDTDGTSRLTGYATLESMRTDSEFSKLHWQFIGPTNISGRCTDVEAVTPRGKSYTIWVASATGGIWKSENEGVTFEPVFEHYGTTSIGDLAISPSNPEIVWAGTGEANIFRSSNPGTGVYRTTDNGMNWQHMGLENTYTIARIIIHPTNPDIVYVAATGHEWTKNSERGLYKTTDGGKSWTPVLQVDDETGVVDVVMDPNDPNTLYAATWQRTRLKWNDPRTYSDHKNNGIWKTSDGGRSWNRINDGLPDAPYRGRIGLTISRSNPNILYALVDNYEIAYMAKKGETDAYGRQKKNVIRGATLFRTDNGGGKWKQVSGLTDETRRQMENHSGTYGWVFGQVRVDPQNPDCVYTLGLWLNKSTDGGRTFERIRKIHADQHGLWIDPENSSYLLEVHDGGLSVSYDQGKNWRSFIEELPLAQFYNVALDNSEPFRAFGSIQDHHSYYGVVDLSRGRDRIRPTEWTPTLGAEGSSHAVSPTDNNTIYASLFYGKLARAKIDTYPESMEWLLPERYPEEVPFRGQWVAPTLISPHNPSILYHGVQFVMKSIDGGDTWTQISPDLTGNDPKKMGDISYQTISALSESPFRPGLLYAGTDDGRVWRTGDGGQNWENIRSGEVPERWVSRIVASVHRFGTVYLTQTGRRDDDARVYIWRSDDFGATWKDISGNIPLGPVNVIREDPFDEQILYAGTDAGVFISTSGGESWQVLGDLPCTYVHDLAIQQRDNMIVIATHGRGMFVLDANPLNEKARKEREDNWDDFETAE
ncbi:MAG: WD40/YVTN/BNR-like repeat-containing protein [Bacteroidota bacterium]